jgi:hypothetical protein
MTQLLRRTYLQHSVCKVRLPLLRLLQQRQLLLVQDQPNVLPLWLLAQLV